MAKTKATVEYFIPGDKSNCPVKWSDEYECWIIGDDSIIKAMSDPDIDRIDLAIPLTKIIKKADLGSLALPIAIEALKHVRQEVEFEGYYEQDVLKLAEKILKDEYKVNRYNYE